MNLDFPFHFDARGATASTGYADHVRDMIEQLLFTTPGERVNRPEFGCGLLQLVFSPNSPELAVTVQFTTQAALAQWLGDVIDVHSLEVEARDSTLRVALSYGLRNTSEEFSVTFEREIAS